MRIATGARTTPGRRARNILAVPALSSRTGGRTAGLLVTRPGGVCYTPPRMNAPAPAPARTWRRTALRWAWLPVTAIAVAALLQLVDLAEVSTALADADPAALAAMVAVWLAWLALRPLRMRLLVVAAQGGRPVAYDTAFGAHAVGNALNGLLPMRAGEFAMLYVLRRRAGVPVAASLPAVVLDRLCDLASAVTVLAVAIFLMPDRPQAVADGLAVVVAAMLAGVVAAAIAVRSRRATLAVVGRLLPARHADRLLPRLDVALGGLAVLARPSVFLRAAALSAAIWGLTVVSFRFGIAAVWPDVGFGMAAFAVGVTAMAFLVPAAPGGIGIFHAANVFALSFFGVPAPAALAFALLTHAATLATGLAVAAAWTAHAGLDPRDVVRAAEDGDRSDARN